MANITIKRYNGSAWDIHYPKTIISQVVNLSTTLANMQDDIDGKQNSLGFSPLNKAGDTMTGPLNMGSNRIDFQESHFINRRFEMDSVDNNSVVYILLCRNAGGNDVNGTITMDRTSGLRHAMKVDIIVSAGSSAAPVGSVVSHGISGGGAPSYRLVTLTYNSESYVALEITNPDNYYETTGAYFNGRILNTGGYILTPVLPANVSSVSTLGFAGSYKVNNSTVILEGDSRLTNARPASDVYSWAKASSKPSYSAAEVGAAPTSHNHTKSQITDFPTSMPASDVYSWAKASVKPSYVWSDIGSKPTNIIRQVSFSGGTLVVEVT